MRENIPEDDTYNLSRQRLDKERPKARMDVRASR